MSGTCALLYLVYTRAMMTKTDLLATEALMNIAAIKAARSPRTVEQERDARGRMFSERSSYYLSRGATNRQAYELAMDDVAAQF